MARPRVELPDGLARQIAQLRQEITQADENLEGYRRQMTSAVFQAQALGYSWRAIGEALGISAQAAHERFAGPVLGSLRDDSVRLDSPVELLSSLPKGPQTGELPNLTGMVRTCRVAVRDAFVRLERRHGRRDFDLADIVTETLAHDPQFAKSTVSTHVTSRLCANAPDHHGTVYADLERVGRGRYRRR
jgi:hypothetical protein